MPHMDDLIESRPEQILFSHRSCFFGRIAPPMQQRNQCSYSNGIQKMKLQVFLSFQIPNPCNLNSRPWPKKRPLDHSLTRCSQATNWGGDLDKRAHFHRPQPFAAAAFETATTLGGDTNDTNSTLSDIGPIRRACIVVALEAGNGLLLFLKLVFSQP